MDTPRRVLLPNENTVDVKYDHLPHGIVQEHVPQIDAGERVFPQSGDEQTWPGEYPSFLS